MSLTQSQLQNLDQQLSAHEAATQAEVCSETRHRLDEPYAELAGAVADPGDASVADLIVDIDNARINRHIDELRGIETARERMKNGLYGICIDCEEDIEYARLCAFPTAIRCTRCQAMRERTYATTAHPTL